MVSSGNQVHYKDLCRRFVKIFGAALQIGDGNLSLLHGCEYLCCKCKGVLCSKHCMENGDELIIFDFGSKTTWFKYESENTGQLSMHPTVAPMIDVSVADMIVGELVEDPKMLSDACPVCTKIIKKRLANLGQTTALHKDKKRVMSTFTKLSLRSLHCFDSSQLDSEETEYSIQGVAPCNLNPCDLPCQSKSDVDCKVNNDRIEQEKNPLASSICDMSQVEPLLFLMTHMLKRSAFLPSKNIPFVICEPLHFHMNMKKELIRYVFEELKVPG